MNSIMRLILRGKGVSISPEKVPKILEKQDLLCGHRKIKSPWAVLVAIQQRSLPREGRTRTHGGTCLFQQHRYQSGTLDQFPYFWQDGHR